MQASRKEEDNQLISCQRFPPSTSGAKYRKGGHRKSNVDESKDGQGLQQLPCELLELIAKRLNVIDFGAFGAVCKGWWEIFDKSKEDFLELQAPMAVVVSPHAKRSCYLIEMVNGNTKKVRMPNLALKNFLGCSAGYVILEDFKRQLTLVNPLNEREFSLNAQPFILKDYYLFQHSTASSIWQTRSHILIEHTNCRHELRLFHSKARNCVTGLFLESPWVDITTFNDQVYVLSKNAHFGVLRIKERTIFNQVVVKNTPIVDSYDLKLVVSDDQILMVDFVPEKYLNIYKLDYNAIEWIKVNELGDQALFFGSKYCSSMIRKPAKWEVEAIVSIISRLFPQFVAYIQWKLN